LLKAKIKAGVKTIVETSVKRTIQLSILVVMLGVLPFAALHFWQWLPQSESTGASEQLVADLTRPGLKTVLGSGEFATAGRLMHHMQSAATIADWTIEEKDGKLTALRIVNVEIPEGGALTFDLHVPEPLLMYPTARVKFSIDADVGQTDWVHLFRYTYMQDWLSYGLNRIRESWQLGYHFLDRFRHFRVDLSQYAGSSARLIFRAEADLVEWEEGDPSPKGEYEKRGGFQAGPKFAFYSPRVWGSRATDTATPNIVVCFVDGLRTDALNIYGYERQTTPNIAALAERGITAAWAFAPSNATRNSITSVFAGRRASLLGLPMKEWDLTPAEKTAFSLLTDDEQPSMPRYLAGQGYATGFVGSNPFIVPAVKFGVDLGFQVTESLNQRRFDTEAIAERSLHFIDENAGRPFMLYIHFNNGHGPLDPPKRHDRFQRTEGETNPPWPPTYDGEIAYADEKIGEILARLDALGLMDNTLFVLTADHGETYDEGKPKGHAHSLYDVEIRVPLVMSLPGTFQPGSRLPGMRSLLDLYPTVLELLGKPVPEWLDGFSLLSMESTRQELYLEGAGILAARTEDRKLIVKEGPYEKMKGDVSTDGGKLIELYALDQDHYEEITLAGAGLDEENEFLEKLFAFKRGLARKRAEQIDAIGKRMGSEAETLYPARLKETHELVLAAGNADRTFEVFLKADRILGSYLGKGFGPGDKMFADDASTAVAFLAEILAGESKRFSFSPFPPDDPFELEIWVDGKLLAQDRIRIGPNELAFQDNPMRVARAVDNRLMTSNQDPNFEVEEPTAWLWRWRATKDATTAAGGALKNALKAWGYVK
jgi:arylsulfatase A-like enzyme